MDWPIDKKTGKKIVPSLAGRDANGDMLVLADAFFENLRRDDVEFGGWGIDSKRPFGNSDATRDILQLLGIKPEFNCRHCGASFSEDQDRYAADLYSVLGPFLANKWSSLRTVGGALCEAQAV